MLILTENDVGAERGDRPLAVNPERHQPEVPAVSVRGRREELFLVQQRALRPGSAVSQSQPAECEQSADHALSLARPPSCLVVAAHKPVAHTL